MGRSQYNRLAALNNIIMVYPDTRCWNNDDDVDGIDPTNYNKKTGILPTAIKAMIDRVTGGIAEDSSSSEEEADEEEEADADEEVSSEDE